MKNIGFVFARGGSKGIPRKNLQLVNDQTLLARSIDALRQSAVVEEVFVSSDDDEILHEAESNGARSIKRPTALASDTSNELDSWKHAILYVREHAGHFDVLVSAPTTSPLRQALDVQNCVHKRQRHDADICFTVTPSARSPWFNMVTKGNDDTIRVVIESGATRRQDVPACFDLTTVAYAARADWVLQTNSLFQGKAVAVEVPFPRSIDVDTPSELTLCRILEANKHEFL